MSPEDIDLECMTAVCFLTIFSTIALMAGPIGFLFVIFGVLVVANGIKSKKRAKEVKSLEDEERAGSGVVRVERRVIYQLPSRCPECGASLSNEEADWVGPLQARCPFCRATVEAVPSEF